MTKISLILNTCSLDSQADQFRNPFRSTSYRDRAVTLEETISLMEGFDEIIVAGSFKEDTQEKFPRWKYVPVQPRFRDRRDALYQREFGARHSTGDVLVFCHDDHRPGAGFSKTLIWRYIKGSKYDKILPYLEDWDLIVPERRHFVTDEILNNGKESDYMGGHCLVMRRSLWAEVPWTTLDTEFWDTSMTRLWREKGVIQFVDDLVHLDMEATEDEH